MTEQTGTCGRCQQIRIVEPYQPRHTHWPVPQLCADCTELEAAEEKAGRPRSVGEQRVTEFLLRGAELDEQRQAS